jgi:hypothetical protein
MPSIFRNLLCWVGRHSWGATERLSVFGQDYHDTRVCTHCRRMETPVAMAFGYWTHANG